MKSIARSHLIVATLSLVLLLVTVAAFIIFVGKIHAREQRVLDARDQVASYQQNKRALAEESTRLDSVKTRIATLQKNIVTEDTTPTLLSSIETLAKNDGITFTLTTVSATSATANQSAKLHLDFSAVGSFTNTQRFIVDLQSQPYQIQMTKLSLYLGAAEKGGTSWQLLAGMDILSF